MATKQSDERPTKRRARQAQPETGTKKPASKPAAKKRAAAAAKKRSDKTPAKRSRPTLPARPRAKRAEAAEPIESAPGAIPVPVPVPAPTAPRQEDTVAASPGEPPSRPASYLESVPRDHAELLSAFLQVVRGAAKDIKTLITQAIAMSHQDDRIDR